MLNTFVFVGKLCPLYKKEEWRGSASLICRSGGNRIHCKIQDKRTQPTEYIFVTGDGEQKFADAYAFADYVLGAAVKDQLYQISGTWDFRYDIISQKFFSVYRVTRIEIPSGGEVYARLRTPLFLDASCANVWNAFFDYSVGDIGFSPINVADPHNLLIYSSDKISSDGIIRTIVDLDVINGTQYHDITLDDLSAPMCEAIEFDILQKEEIFTQLGGRIAGDVVSELRVVSVTSFEKTQYKKGDMLPASIFNTDLSRLDTEQLQHKIKDLYLVGDSRQRKNTKIILSGRRLSEVNDRDTLIRIINGFRWG